MESHPEIFRDIPKGSGFLVAMSGGVDSSVAAYVLMQAGMKVLGITMHLAREDDCTWKGASSSLEKACCSISGAVEARKVAEMLGIQHQVIDLSADFQEHVINPTRKGYQCGFTPNPCVFCNRFIKFRSLLDWVKQLGYKYLATGHYARIVKDESGLHLLRGIDRSKDQSYFLSYLTSRQMEQLVFPLGWTTKDEVRDIARKLGLEVADRPESQDLCFFSTESEKSTMEACPAGKTGEIVTSDGIVIGHHTGIENYTRGQRKGLPGGQPEPIYVVDLDPETNRVIVGADSEGYSISFEVKDISLVNAKRDRSRLESHVLVQIRYRSRPVTGAVSFIDDTHASVKLTEPARAVTPGQIAVWYESDEVLGAGTISKVELSK